jgi:hypothetical protein
MLPLQANSVKLGMAGGCYWVPYPCAYATELLLPPSMAERHLDG